jgi:hypothetical protein
LSPSSPSCPHSHVLSTCHPWDQSSPVFCLRSCSVRRAMACLTAVSVRRGFKPWCFEPPGTREAISLICLHSPGIPLLLAHMCSTNILCQPAEYANCSSLFKLRGVLPV